MYIYIQASTTCSAYTYVYAEQVVLIKTNEFGKDFTVRMI